MSTNTNPGSGFRPEPPEETPQKTLAAARKDDQFHNQTDIPIDPFRTIVFPNRVREQRQRSGVGSLLTLSSKVPQVPYIRLSKIERGEVFARAKELAVLAQTLGIDDPIDLLIDVEHPDFSIEQWVGRKNDSTNVNREAEELAMLLAAALRARRANDPMLTLARFQQVYKLPAVIISRIENAAKPLDRWNRRTIASICALFGAKNRATLDELLLQEWEAGALSDWLARIPNAAQREARTQERVRILRAELEASPPVGIETRTSMWGSSAHQPEGALCAERTLPIIGAPLEDGLVAPLPIKERITLPRGTGANAYALRMCRPSLGAAIPGNAILVVDPDRYPINGGLAILREEMGLRVLIITIDRDGHLHGHSSNPEKDIALDTVPPHYLAAVTAILFP